MSDGAVVDEPAIRLGRSAVSGLPEGPGAARVPGVSIDAFLEDVERRTLVQAMAEVGTKQRDLARYLGITERSLRYRLGKHRMGGQADEAAEATKSGGSD